MKIFIEKQLTQTQLSDLKKLLDHESSYNADYAGLDLYSCVEQGSDSTTIQGNDEIADSILYSKICNIVFESL